MVLISQADSASSILVARSNRHMALTCGFADPAVCDLVGRRPFVHSTCNNGFVTGLAAVDGDTGVGKSAALGCAALRCLNGSVTRCVDCPED
jgi:hypothetical protein